MLIGDFADYLERFMPKDEICDLGRVARKITGLQTFTRAQRRHRELRADTQPERWRLIKDWLADCSNELNRVLQGFYPKRLVRRLKRALKYVDGVIQKVWREPKLSELKPGTSISRARDDTGMFAKLMAEPSGQGYLLN